MASSPGPAEVSKDGLDELMSMEHLEDRASPELWPEQLPGVNEFSSMNFSRNSESEKQPVWMKELMTEDANMVQELGSLTPAQLMEKVRQLQNLAYQLGLEEAREMTRAKFLRVLERR